MGFQLEDLIEPKTPPATPPRLSASGAGSAGTSSSAPATVPTVNRLLHLNIPISHRPVVEKRKEPEEDLESPKSSPVLPSPSATNPPLLTDAEALQVEEIVETPVKGDQTCGRKELRAAIGAYKRSRTVKGRRFERKGSIALSVLQAFREVGKSSSEARKGKRPREDSDDVSTDSSDSSSSDTETEAPPPKRRAPVIVKPKEVRQRPMEEDPAVATRAMAKRFAVVDQASAAPDRPQVGRAMDPAIPLDLTKTFNEMMQTSLYRTAEHFAAFNRALVIAHDSQAGYYVAKMIAEEACDNLRQLSKLIDSTEDVYLRIVRSIPK